MVPPSRDKSTRWAPNYYVDCRLNSKTISLLFNSKFQSNSSRFGTVSLSQCFRFTTVSKITQPRTTQPPQHSKMATPIIDSHIHLFPASHILTTRQELSMASAPASYHAPTLHYRARGFFLSMEQAGIIARSKQFLCPTLSNLSLTFAVTFTL